jgi:hypothetical protein
MMDFDSKYRGTSVEKWEKVSQFLQNSHEIPTKEEFCASFAKISYNMFRPTIAPALNQALLEVISPCLKEGYPGIEIGSGPGYSLPPSLILTQPDLNDCQMLRRQTDRPIYQANIEQLCALLSPAQEAIPLVVLLNILDTMNQEDRLKNLTLISKLQKPGHKILSILDTNPLLNQTIPYLAKTHPGYFVLPYLPTTNTFSMPQSWILVPQNLWTPGPVSKPYHEIFGEATEALKKQRMSDIQTYLHRIKEQYNLEIISLEDTFTHLLKTEFNRLGYTCRIFYHASFVSVDRSSVKDQATIEALCYRAVSDSFTLRTWALNDPNFAMNLKKRGISIPREFCDPLYTSQCKATDQIILGAEILVAEATQDP